MASANGCTGDVRNNLAKLLREIQRMKLSVEPSIHGLSLGIPSAFLPIIHCALMQYSVPLANWLASHDYELYAKNDFRFLEGVYKVIRDVFFYRPRLSMNQFLDVGYAERKIIMTTDILRYCQAKHHELVGRPTHLKTRRKIYSVAASAPIGGTEVYTVSKVHVKDSRSTSASSEHQPPMVDYRAASPLPNPLPHSLSVSPIEYLGSSPCKDSTPHGSHPQLDPPAFVLGLGNAACVDPPSRVNPLPPTTYEAPKMEGMVIRHKEVTKTTGLHTHRQEEADRGSGMPSFPPFLQSGKEKPKDDTESVTSWESLPMHEEQQHHDNQDGRQDQDVKQRLASSYSDDGRDVCTKIDQLTQMIEKLSARFVIFETQMKLVESQRGKPVNGGQQQGEVPYQPEDKKLPQSIPSSSLPPPPSGTANHSDQPTVHIAPRTHSTIQPKSLGTASSSMGTQGAVVREQGRQVVHTERGSPIRARLAWSSLAKSNLLDGVDQSSPVVQSPSTPEDTRRLIEGLRQRAKKTKDFLDKATL